MSLNRIKQTIEQLFEISKEAFEIQVYDERFKDWLVLDDEYLEELRTCFPLTSINTLFGDILLNYPSSTLIEGCYRRNRCDKEANLNDSVCELSYECPTTDDENKVPEEVSLIHKQQEESECFDALLIATPEKEKADVCLQHQHEYRKNSSHPINHVNPTDFFSSNDEIRRHICDPDRSIIQENSETSFQSDNNELHIIKNTDLEAQILVQNIVDAVVKQPANIGTNPTESLYINWCNQNSDDLSSLLPAQIVQQPLSMRLSPSLQFVHDVHPYQKTQRNLDNFDECQDIYLSPYVMRIQGIKTNVDKEKSVLPRIKIPEFYRFLREHQKKSCYLIIAAVREEKVNDKRFFYACGDKLFLPAGIERSTKAVNPIQLGLDSLPIESDGTSKLSLRLVSQPPQSTTKQSQNRLFCEIDEEIAANLHPTPYDSRFFRLLCTLVKDDTIAWDTLCLSDYIRPKQQLQP